MGRDLTIPKRGDLVVCVRSGFICGSRPYTTSNGRSIELPLELQEGTMGIVTCARNSKVGAGTLSITWFDGTKTKHHYSGSWARQVNGWKQWLRVVEHK